MNDIPADCVSSREKSSILGPLDSLKEVNIGVFHEQLFNCGRVKIYKNGPGYKFTGWSLVEASVNIWIELIRLFYQIPIFANTMLHRELFPIDVTNLDSALPHVMTNNLVHLYLFICF